MKRLLVLAVLGATLLACAEPSLKGRMEQPLLACGAGRAYLVAPDGGRVEVRLRQHPPRVAA